MAPLGLAESGGGFAWLCLSWTTKLQLGGFFTASPQLAGWLAGRSADWLEAVESARQTDRFMETHRQAGRPEMEVQLEGEGDTLEATSANSRIGAIKSRRA